MHASPIGYANLVLVTPTALNSRAQRRVAHAGLPITHTVEPQRGSTKGAGKGVKPCNRALARTIQGMTPTLGFAVHSSPVTLN